MYKASLSKRITESILVVIFIVILVTSRYENQYLSLSYTVVNATISVKFDSRQLRQKWAPEVLFPIPLVLSSWWRLWAVGVTWYWCIKFKNALPGLAFWWWAINSSPQKLTLNPNWRVICSSPRKFSLPLQFFTVITRLTALHKPFRRAVLGSPRFFKRQALHYSCIGFTFMMVKKWKWENNLFVCFFLFYKVDMIKKYF